ncbi:hypothetical protein J2S98_004564 [Arthrobacter oryzae]|uniref:hypothetical protein n=1 Tax=Arthrobacter TaxID=1663 RepID=UPI001F444208|nr:MULTISPECIES: hypothetical protein [Arthrobacter]MDP9989374.1 hypothetical protein [Arthrobacter oryzae]UKA71456.1 hypothetical protein LFT49_01520 [Arthrobacter sp. FW306-06-A]
MNDQTGIGQTIRQAVLSTDGVERLYPVDSTWKAALKGGIALATGQGTTPQEVDLQIRAQGPTVRLRIGVTGTVPAPAVARNVSTVVRRHLLDAFPGQEPQLTVQICSIGTGSQQPEAAM